MSEDKKATPAVEKKEVQIDVNAEREIARKEEQQRIRAIDTIGKKFEREEMARKFIDEGRSVEAFNKSVLESMETPEIAVPDIDMTPKESREYSLFKAVRAASNNDWSEAGFERECSIAIAERLGRDPKGFFIPQEVQKRVMMVGDDAAGGYAVGTEHMAGSFIDNLRAETIAGQLGVTFLTGLVGDIDIPKKTTSATFYWLGEDDDATNSDLALGSVTMSPRTVAGSVPVSRRLLKQSSPDVEAMVQSDLAKGCALALDDALINGTGHTGEPLGMINVTGVNTQTISSAGVPTYLEMIGFETALGTDNALTGSLKYLTTPAVMGKMKGTSTDSGSGIFVADNNGNVNGYECLRSTQVVANGIYFGDWSSALIGMWGVMDVVVDSSTKAASGGLVLRVFQDVDVAFRHPESFCINA